MFNYPKKEKGKKLPTYSLKCQKKLKAKREINSSDHPTLDSY